MDSVSDSAITCYSNYPLFGSHDVYVVKDRIQGPSYSVTVLKGLTTNEIRVAWNNQLPSTYGGVVGYVHGTDGYFNWFSSQAEITGACGMSLGSPAGGFQVVVDFGGIDVFVGSSTSASYTLTVSVSYGSKFDIGLTNVNAGIQTNFGVSGSIQLTEIYTVSWTSKLKRFDQTYDASRTPQVHPISTA